MNTRMKRLVSLVLMICMLLSSCAFGEEAEIVDAATEPVVAEQVTEEPVTEEPVTGEPAVEEPAVEEPVVEEPVVEEPVVEEPVVEEPVVEEPVVEEPVVEEPVVEEPVVEEPVVEEPVVEEPVVEEPVVEEPVVEEPVIEEPVVEEPVTEEPVVEEPVVEEPATEEPATEEPVAEEAVAKEPVVKESVVAEAVIEEPVTEETEEVLTENESQGESLLTGYTEREDYDDLYVISEFDDETDDWISDTEYDQNGNKTYYAYPDSEGNIIGTKYEYDEEGNLQGYDVDSDQYDENGKLVGSTVKHYDNEGNLLCTNISKDDGTGFWVDSSYRADGSTISESEYTYDENGNRIQYTRFDYDENGIIEYIDQYDIDENGEWHQVDTSGWLNTIQFVVRMYEVVLNRTPDKDGLNYWVDSLMSNERAAGEIVDGFFNSDEYKNSGKSNEEIVQDCYHAMLNRDADEGGQEYWENRLNVGMTAQTVLNGFVGSQEFMNLCDSYGIDYGNIELHTARDQNYERTYFVYRLYANCLGREPDTEGQENWCAALMNGATGSDVAYGFIFSQELKDYHLDNGGYVDMMYYTLMGRDPDDAGFEDWEEQLDYTRTREHVFNGFLFSQEFQQQCAVAEINVGNPIAEPDDSVEWQFNVDVLRLCNEQRESNGLWKLSTREDLWQDVAMARASGTSYDTVMNNIDFDPDYFEIHENIATGFNSAEEVVNYWMNTEEYRNNILSEYVNDVATGYDQDGSFVCQDYWEEWGNG